MNQFKFENPNYTMAPNDLFDHLLKQIDDMSELKVTLAAIRMTIGYHEDEAELSQDYLEKMTGLSRNSVRRGLALALRRGTIVIRKKSTNRTGAIYSLGVKSRGSATDPLEGQPQTPLKKGKEIKQQQKRGDALNGKNESSRAIPDPDFGKAFTELSEVVAMTPSSIDKFQLLWDEFPDLRRHTRAVESLKAKQDPNYNYYETVFRNFNPDWKPPTKPTTAPFVRQANRSAHAPSTAPPGSTWEERAAAYTKRSEDAYFRDRPEMRAKP